MGDVKDLVMPVGGPYGSEQQLVRLDGTVLVSFVVPAGQRMYYMPPLGMDIQGPCAGRVRDLPRGDWHVLAYFPEGWPGPAEPWPGNALNEGETSWPGTVVP